MDRTGGRADGAGSQVQFCSVCIRERRRESFRQWAERDTNRTSRRAYQQQYRARYPDRVHDAWLRSRHGLTLEDYNVLLAKQGGGCGICGRTDPATGSHKHLQVDHDHACCPNPGRSCGRCVRGLLCGVCNKMLGAIGDDVFKLNRAIDYLSQERRRG